MRARKPNPLERDRVLAILQYVQAKYPQWLWVRCEPPGAMRQRARKAKGERWIAPQPEDAWGNGVADILGMRRGYDSIALEVKRPPNTQEASQIDFERRFNAMAGRYYVVHDPGEVERAMQEMGYGRGTP